MEIIAGNYLDNGKLFNDGRPTDIIRIEDPADYDQLVENIRTTDYYGRKYFEGNLGYQGRALKLENLPFAVILDFLKPESFLELGCGRGDLLFYLNLGTESRVSGIDIAPSVKESAFQEIRDNIHIGDLLDVSKDLGREKKVYDTFCALDIWEHLHPAKLDGYIKAMLDLADENALFFFVVPAYGEDEVFGEQFPVELGENLPSMEKGEPFSYLLAEFTDPPVPINGHLIWAPTNWWEGRFSSHGMVRLKELETMVHRYMDRYLARAQKSFYIFARDTEKARQRNRFLLQNGLTYMHLWRTYLKYKRALEEYRETNDREIVDYTVLTRNMDDVVFRLLDNMEQEIHHLKTGGASQPWPWPVRLLKKLLGRG
ncbi:class I SAM-dependent methyltransferase [Dethiosulfatarculus sandiegensis]|uniref:Methyltransferase domain-containing protein n=1 Tax=Dethiosulfatarculus sandiegensis TaxID=1429043 RepID=A0A0D2GLD0_9BACT|nr:class I SAM-dependent methyltransferase [Dethiosulfatarculus sandiegensis]KIX15472.1 hypothetical protein X474_04250 [Dethiosulfatarculus sandiegensis]